MNGARIPLRSACRGKPGMAVNGAERYRWVPFVLRVLPMRVLRAAPLLGSYFGAPLWGPYSGESPWRVLP
jgi:hypothetical protein